MGPSKTTPGPSEWPQSLSLALMGSWVVQSKTDLSNLRTSISSVKRKPPPKD